MGSRERRRRTEPMRSPYDHETLENGVTTAAQPIRKPARTQPRTHLSALLLLAGIAGERLVPGRVRSRRQSSSWLPLLVIEPAVPGVFERLVELWRFRGLCRHFARRLLEKRTRRTWLGYLWLPLRPAINVASSALVFGGVLGVATGKIPYVLFFLVGAGAWHLFAETSYWSTRSLELNRSMLRRIYVPRLVVVFAAVALPLFDWMMYAIFAVIATVAYGIGGSFYFVGGMQLLLVPAGLVLMLLLGLGVGLILAPLAAQARDVRLTLRYVLGFWYFLTPVIYPITAIPAGTYRLLAELNPVTGAVEMVKAGAFDTHELTWTAAGVTLGFTVALWVFGLWLFGRSEARMIDKI